MISESIYILNNVSILSSCILNNVGFLAHWETESVTAEIFVTLLTKVSGKKQLFMYSCYKNTKKQLLVCVCKKYTKSKISGGILGRWQNTGGLCKEYLTHLFFIFNSLIPKCHTTNKKVSYLFCFFI